MTKPYFRAIVLVPASFTIKVYYELIKIWRAYMNLEPTIKCFFVHGNSHYPRPDEPDELYFPDIKECWIPGMVDKTRAATQHVVENYEFDFLIRTNLSTFWIWPRLLERLNTLPTNNCFIGDMSVLEPRSVIGFSLIMSKDVATDFAYCQLDLNTINRDQPEDKTISRWLREFKKQEPQFYKSSRCERLEFKTAYSPDDVTNHIKNADKLGRDHFRIKNMDNRDTIDIAILNHLLKHYYNHAL
jgi:hypothetical protein